MSSNQRILVLGVGNEILTDDGIGPKIVNRLKSDFSSLPDNINFENLFIGGLGVMEFIQGYNVVIILDAIRTRGGIPGDVYHFTPDDFKETLHLSSFHDASFLTALKFGKKLGFDIPKRIEIIAIEIIEDRIFSNDFTPPVQKRYEEIYKHIQDYIKTSVVQA